MELTYLMVVHKQHYLPRWEARVVQESAFIVRDAEPTKAPLPCLGHHVARRTAPHCVTTKFASLVASGTRNSRW